MKLYKRCLSLLLLSVCLFGVFSLDVKAEESVKYKMGGRVILKNERIVLNALTGDNITLQTPVENVSISSDLMLRFYPSFERVDGDPIVKKGKSFNLSFNNFKPYLYFVDTGTKYNWTDPDWYVIDMVYTDGSVERIPVSNCDYVFSSSSLEATFSLKANGTANKDVERIDVLVHYIPYKQIGSNLGNRDIQVYVEMKPVSFSVDIKSEEAGLLGGILGWVQNIFNKIGDTFDTLVEGFSNIGKWFAELPQKLWSVISEGLKSLFIPTEEKMLEIKQEYEDLLADRLGAVYQVGDVLIDSWEEIKEADEQDKVTMPKVSINLPENNKFEFGGFDVKIVPDGFGTLVDAVKLIVGIICTCLFFNGLLKRYDEVMGVEQ